ncbi:protein-lysine N-methyltransferase EEF2KMT isoform X1 [Zeugodacus cucurbitae]|uniref:protein-lysine N-methyltransferase EEF2KMT isoform X1 n=1 Tax=Zeugodacus cucurbitae TaxID=28588 RepID=UPI0023D96AED|nr:protein-lysine N-methyltransferase EEF2KMT isoform X1 [Zeugodacus cucurbitae]XP_054086853.1 protein-lysine N-methyltransferase EEF2KMT isoform X1 [Zeugodacus cucurbitae]XP_054086854.1 protein-lysine N-methyltransferase EEF2KMT isoform X1 [Zeugodacus cucurbitae]
MKERSEKYTEALKYQFLCCYPLHCIDWDALPKELTWEQQKELVENTALHPLNKKYPTKISYQLNFLKRLLQQLEKHCEEVHDIVYESYCAVQQRVAKDTTEKYAYKHYVQPSLDVSFTLRESKSFVAEGTTGLCSWQASIALADYLVQNAEIVSGKCVLELGAGTGLCGMIALQCCGVRHMLLTDGSRECIELMKENVLRNFSEASEISDGEYGIKGKFLNLCELEWGAIDEMKLPNGFSTDVILAADVVYDDTVFDALTHAIDNVFKMKQDRCEMLLAATVRNEHTLNKFLNLLSTLDFQYAEKDLIPLDKCNFYWDRTTLVKIFHITRKS